MTAENPSDPHLTVEQLAALWRRQFECMDTLVHGFLGAEMARQAGCDPGPAAVTFADLSGARHSLSIPRFYPQRMLTVDEFRHSDPTFEFYAGKLEAEFARVRNESDGEFA